MAASRSRSAQYLFGPLGVPLGIYIGFGTILMPFLLRKAGVAIGTVATIAALVAIPSASSFLCSPLVDMKFRRRTWSAITGAVAAICLGLAVCCLGSDHLGIMTGLAVVAGVSAFLGEAASGGLMITTLDRQGKEKAAVWHQAGKLGGSALVAGALLWLATNVSLGIAGTVAASLIGLTSLFGFFIDEPMPLSKASFGGQFRNAAKELREVLKNRGHRWTAVLLIMPGGTGALKALLAALTTQYGVDSNGVIWVNGVLGGVLLATGSLSGALFPSRWDRRLSFAVACLLNAIAATMLLLGNRPSVYIAGTVAYLLTSGLCWGRYAAMIVDVVGAESTVPGSAFSILSAIGNLPIVYMVALEGLNYDRYGIPGVLWTDAGGNILVFLAVAVFSIWLRDGGSERSGEANPS